MQIPAFVDTDLSLKCTGQQSCDEDAYQNPDVKGFSAIWGNVDEVLLINDQALDPQRCYVSYLNAQSAEEPARIGSDTSGC